MFIFGHLFTSVHLNTMGNSTTLIVQTSKLHDQTAVIQKRTTYMTARRTFFSAVCLGTEPESLLAYA